MSTIDILIINLVTEPHWSLIENNSVPSHNACFTVDDHYHCEMGETFTWHIYVQWDFIESI